MPFERKEKDCFQLWYLGQRSIVRYICLGRTAERVNDSESLRDFFILSLCSISQ